MPSSGGGSQVSSSEVPKQYKDFGNQNLAIAGTMANSPYVGYGGPQVAGWSGDQKDAFEMTRQTAQATPQRDYGYGIASEVANTGVQDVTQMATDELLRSNQMMNRDTRSRLSGANGAPTAYGGARGALLEAENNRNTMDAVARSAANLGFSGQQLRLAGAGAMNDIGSADLNRNLTAANALMGTGSQQQNMDQANLDVAYNAFLDEQEHPMRMLAMRQSALGQTPMGSIQRSPKPGMDVGGLLGGAGTFAMGAAKLAAIPCWVAREVYGEDDPRWIEYRDKMFAHGSDELVSAYTEHGPAFAEHIRHNPAMKAQVREAMDMVLAA